MWPLMFLSEFQWYSGSANNIALKFTVTIVNFTSNVVLSN